MPTEDAVACICLGCREYDAYQALHDAAHRDVIDRASYAYVLWKWSTGLAEISASRARTLVKVAGAESVDQLERYNLVRRAGSEFRALPLDQRLAYAVGRGRDLDDGPLIDVVHAAAASLRCESAGPGNLFLEALPGERLTRVRDFAESFAALLRRDAEEQHLMREFVAACAT
jgi:hypothetical protein